DFFCTAQRRRDYPWLAVASRMVSLELVTIVGVAGVCAFSFLDLHGGMLDAETQAQSFHDRGERLLPVCALIEVSVQSHHGGLSGQGPRVYMVNSGNTRQRSELFLHLTRVEAAGCAFEQHVGRIPRELPARSEDQQ